jgi:zinc protease
MIRKAGASSVILSVSLSLSLLLFSACAAQQAAPAPVPAHVPAATQAAASAGAAVDPGPPPLDARVKRGKLANGLTYFILPHTKPEKRAYFWLVVNAGSTLEDDDQQGLAHFIEHMGFNGTRRFPKQDIVNFVERAGMSFGAHLNAYTSFDETVYTLQVPTDSPELVDKALQILRDWAGDVTLDGPEIEKERGVVLEEWRLGRGAGRRLFDKQSQVVFRGSKYPNRIPIGKPEVIKSAPREALVRFYKDWYRPDLMAVIAVGDFAPAEIEHKIASEFAGLQNPAHERPRVLSEIPAHAETLVTVETDPEMTVTTVGILNKMAHRPERSDADFRRMLAEELYHSMLNARLDELRRKPDAPFLQGGSRTASMVRSADVFSLQALAKEGEVEPTLEALLGELHRVESHGFTKTEVERAKKTVLRQVGQAVLERDKLDGRAFASELVRYFLEDEAMTGPEAEKAAAERLLPTITPEELSQLARTWVGGGNRVVAIAGPEKMKKPPADRIAAIVAAVENKQIAAYDDAVSAAPLLGNKPKPGRVVSTRTIPDVGITEWKLSNGVRVMVKPTTFKNDEIQLSGFSPGGTSLVKDADYDAARFAGTIVHQAGLGAFDAVSLRKVMAGKLVSVNSFVGELEERVTAGSSPEDLETMFELVDLAFTGVRRDEPSFRAWQRQEIEQVRNRKLSPERSFNEEMQVFLSSNHKRRQPTTPEVVEKVALDRSLAIYRDRFRDASDFTFIIVGNVDPVRLQPLVETYLGGLPSVGRKERWRDINVRWPKGGQSKTVVKGQEPKSQVMLAFHGPARFTHENDDDMDVLGEVLSIRLREVLRQEMGGVYGVGARGYITRRPKQEYTFTISFGCAPDKIDTLETKVKEVIAALQKNGISDDYLDKVKQARRRAHEIELKDNGFWERELAEAYRFGEDPRRILDIDSYLARVTSDHVKAAARRYLRPEAYLVGKLKPEIPVAAPAASSMAQPATGP